MCLTPRNNPSALNKEALSKNNLPIDINDNCDYIEDIREISKTDEDFLIVHWNIRSLVHKCSEIEKILNNPTSKVDICILSEMWLKEDSNNKISVTGYNLVSKPRVNKRGGGVGFLLSTDLKYKVREDLNKFTDKNIELCFIELQSRSSNLILGSVYRPPNTDSKIFLTKYHAVLKYLHEDQRKCNYIIGMDHNFDLLKMDVHNATNKFVDINSDNNLWPTITKPTRITKNSATLIDNIMISTELTGDYTSAILIDDLSDHLPCALKLPNYEVLKTNIGTITSRKLTPKALIAIKEELNNPELYDLLNNHEVNETFDCFHKYLQDSIEKHAPLRTFKPKKNIVQNEPWITPGLLRCIKHQKLLYSKSLQRGTGETDLIKYRQYRNCLTKIKRKAKISYYNKQCLKLRHKTKKLWSFINKIINKSNDKSSCIDSLKEGLSIVSDPKDIANTFAKYFANIGSTLARKSKNPQKSVKDYNARIEHNLNSMFMSPVTRTEIDNIIRELPNKTSSGYDNINNMLLKELREEILDPLKLIINQSLSTGTFPNSMKRSDTVPLLKSKSRSEKGNYRPISLLLTVSKILEKVVYNHTYTFLTDTSQITSTQYGFRKHHSCEHAIEELVASILKNTESNKTTVAVYLDLSKAFDTLSHEILLDKLERYGIRGNCLNWFKTYLSNRVLRVKCKAGDHSKTVFSDYYEVAFGAPQGSNLGPLLFLIFVNDLGKHLEYCKNILFADDTTIYNSHSNRNRLEWCINHDLEILSDWFIANKLTLNVSKTVCMIFDPLESKNNSRNQNWVINIGSETINIVNSTKFLGVHIDNKLNWNHHYNSVVHKLKRNMYMLRENKLHLTTETKMQLYYAHFYSHLSYCIVVWGNMLSKNELTKLQKIQNKCLNLVDHRTIPVERKYKDNKILRINEIIMLENEKLGYKLIKKKLPKNITDQIKSDSSGMSLEKDHRYPTRSKSLPNRPVVNKKNYMNSFLMKCLQCVEPFLAITDCCENLHQYVKKRKANIFDPG